jgi:hypothetical protein
MLHKLPLPNFQTWFLKSQFDQNLIVIYLKSNGDFKKATSWSMRVRVEVCVAFLFAKMHVIISYIFNSHMHF